MLLNAYLLSKKISIYLLILLTIRHCVVRNLGFVTRLRIFMHLWKIAEM